MKRAAVFIAAISLALSAQTSQPKTGQIVGKVTDVMGAVIGKADVYIRTYAPPSAKVELVTRTDNSGKFNIAPPEGAYDVLVGSSGFQSSLQSVAVNPGKITQVRFKLQVWPCDRPVATCDYFPTH